MASINLVIRDRKRVVRVLKQKLKIADSYLEKIERRQNSMLSRKLKVPELSDLTFLAQQARFLNQALRVYLEILGRGFPI